MEFNYCRTTGEAWLQKRRFSSGVVNSSHCEWVLVGTTVLLHRGNKFEVSSDDGEHSPVLQRDNMPYRRSKDAFRLLLGNIGLRVDPLMRLGVSREIYWCMRRRGRRLWRRASRMLRRLLNLR
jgi:hypothetical protein